MFSKVSLVVGACICVSVLGQGPDYDHSHTSHVAFTPVHESYSFDIDTNEHVQTFRSQAMPLADGEVVFTDPKTTFLTMPPGRIGIRSFLAQVVDANNVSVPLSEVYNHHWIVYRWNSEPFDSQNAGECPGPLSYRFGVGAESRNTPAAYPAPYALITEEHNLWGANIHLLHTEKVSSVKNCIECAWAPQKGCEKSETGKFACCQNGSFCTLDGAPTPNKKRNYYLEYTVKWVDVTPEVKPVEIMVLDGTPCEIEYNVYENDSGVSVIEQQYTFQYKTGDLVWAVGHQHIGSLNITLSLNGKPVCTNVPRYGNEIGVAGNEKGYLVEIPHCTFTEPIPLSKGDIMKVTGLYNVDSRDARGLPNVSGGSHGCVMSLFYLAISDLDHEPSDSTAVLVA